MKVAIPKRVITWNGETLADLNPSATVEEIVRMHSAARPELATAVVEGPEIGDGTATYTIQTRLGTKG